jgi:phytoene synthase
LVDGPQSEVTTLKTLDEWEERLEKLFAGLPVDDLDVALADTVQQFGMDIQPFRDMIAGQRMDLCRCRYETFEELNLYCYRVAGTVGLMSMMIIGLETPKSIAPWDRTLNASNKPISEAVSLGIAKQLTNILRDIGEDMRRGRIYLPLEELALFNYTEQDLMNGIIDDRWKELMRFQIHRARKFYEQAEKGIRILSEDSRWPVWAALMHYSEILDVIEHRNHYDVFTRRAYVPSLRKLISLPAALLRARVL